MLLDAPYQKGDVVTFKLNIANTSGPVIKTSKIQRIAFSQNTAIYYIDNNPYSASSIISKLDIMPRRTLKDI